MVVFADDNEATTLSDFVEYISNGDFKALVGWNSRAFDVPLFNARAKVLWGDEAVKLEDLVLTLDAMLVHKALLKKTETSYKLDHVAKVYLKKEKLPFNPRKTQEAFDTDREGLKAYNLHDVELLKELDDKLGYSRVFFSVVTISECDEKETHEFMNKKTYDLQAPFTWSRPVLRLFEKYGFPIEYPSDDEKSERGKLGLEKSGGLVFSPVVGVHENVIELDVGSLYPSIVLSLNMGHETYRHKGGDISAEIGTFDSKATSTLVTIYQDLFKARLKVKADLKAAKAATPKDELLIKSLEGESDALKLLMVSPYGQLFPEWSPIYHYEIASNITGIGRKILQKMDALLTARGLRMLAGDTDSSYVAVSKEIYEDPAKTTALVEELNAAVAAWLKETYHCPAPVVHFDFKGKLDRMVFVKTKTGTPRKKGYARKRFEEPEVELIGFERGDVPEFLLSLEREVFQALVDSKPVEPIIERRKAEFLSGTMDKQSITWKGFVKEKGKNPQNVGFRLLKKVGLATFSSDVGYMIVGTGNSERRFYARRLSDTEIDVVDSSGALVGGSFLTPKEREWLWKKKVEDFRKTLP
jgi:DNA polymerase elongation subunit (family B)